MNPIDKVLHELIRDVPEIANMNRKFRLGILTVDDCLREIADIYAAERSNKNG